MRKSLRLTALASATVLLLAACTGATPTPEPATAAPPTMAPESMAPELNGPGHRGAGHGSTRTRCWAW